MTRSQDYLLEDTYTVNEVVLKRAIAEFRQYWLDNGGGVYWLCKKDI